MLATVALTAACDSEIDPAVADSVAGDAATILTCNVGDVYLTPAELGSVLLTGIPAQ